MITPLLLPPLVSALTCAMVLFLSRRPFSAVTGLCVAFLAGGALVLRPSFFIPAAPHGWMLHIAALSWGSAVVLRGQRLWRLNVGDAVGGALCGAVLVWWKVDASGWSLWHVAMVGMVSGVVVAVEAAVGRAVMDRAGGRPALLMWIAVVGATGWAVAWSGFASAAVLAWVLAAAVCVLVPGRAAPHALQTATGTIALLWWGCLMCAVWLSTLPVASVALLAGVPLAVWCATLCRVKRWALGALCCAAVLIPAAAAVWLSVPDERYW